jgi:aspartyl/glutamyl-tRNA(Asn/Gln) amidotransferase C subunit
MATTEEVKKLAALSRISVEESELAKFTKEFDAIIAYVDAISTLKMPEGATGHLKHPLHNVMRVDSTPHPAGTYTQKLVEQFPAREGDALLVKQIIQHG